MCCPFALLALIQGCPAGCEFLWSCISQYFMSSSPISPSQGKSAVKAEFVLWNCLSTVFFASQCQRPVCMNGQPYTGPQPAPWAQGPRETTSLVAASSPALLEQPCCCCSLTAGLSNNLLLFWCKCPKWPQLAPRALRTHSVCPRRFYTSTGTISDYKTLKRVDGGLDRRSLPSAFSA